ncbi:unnamed protein product [Cuscuta europaea]|uniref:Retrotransposon Copia-like N-terminal domain-containing protein n=1 Tax=Cuscuta europaea TaxID=41803 RepID=A0A9P0YHW4_CUSEU|nr:unnamed protein product [Cuscuta europaea]
MDLESPYHLLSSDSPSAVLVGAVLTGIDNYNSWVLAMSMALKGRNKFAFVDGSLPAPSVAHPDHGRWHRVNNMVPQVCSRSMMDVRMIARMKKMKCYSSVRQCFSFTDAHGRAVWEINYFPMK